MSVHRLAFQFGATAVGPSAGSAAERSQTARGAGGSAASFESTLAEQLAEHGDKLADQAQQALPKSLAQPPAGSAAEPQSHGPTALEPQTASGAASESTLAAKLQAAHADGKSFASQILVSQRFSPGVSGATTPSKAPAPSALASPAPAQTVVKPQATQSGQPAKAKSGEGSAKPGRAEESALAPAQIDHAANERALDALALNDETTSAAPDEKLASKSALGAKAGPEKSAAPAKSAGAAAAPGFAQSGSASLVQSAGEAGSDANAEPDSGSASAAAGGERSAAKKVAAFSFKAANETASASDAKPQPAPSSASSAPSTDPGSTKSSEAAASARAVPFAHEADADPSLHVSLLPQAAHMRMDLDGAGDLALHLRLQGGVAHVTVAGSAASLVESHAGDLRTALAGQGLTLGQVQHVAPSAAGQETDASGQQLAQDGSQAQERDSGEPDEPRGKPAPGAASRSSSAFTITRSIASASGKR